MRGFINKNRKFFLHVSVLAFLLFFAKTNVAHAQFNGLMDFFNPVNYVTLLVEALVAVAAGILAISGQLLDIAIGFTLNTDNFNRMTAIDEGWKVIRDLINMSFIFIVLYIAINTILGTSKGASKKVLTNIVVAAILINFSKFFAEVIIDISNIFALAFRGAIQGGELSESLMEGLRLVSAFKPDGGWAVGAIDSLLQAVIRLVVVLLAALAFLYAAVLFIGRTIMLMFLIMSSPIGFIGLILPQLSQHSSAWWKQLINQAMVAPVFLFFMFVLIKIINAQAIVPNNGEALNQYFNYAIMIGFIIMAVKTTSKLSGAIGKVATMAAGLAGGAILGGAALAGRAVGGRAGTAVLNSNLGKSLAQKAENSDKGALAFGSRHASRMALKTATAAKTSTFDVRQTKAGGAALGGLSTATGMNVTKSFKSQKDGYQGSIDRAVKKEEDYNKALGNTLLNEKVTRGGTEASAQDAHKAYSAMDADDTVVHDGKNMKASEAAAATLRLDTNAKQAESLRKEAPDKDVQYDGRTMRASEALKEAEKAEKQAGKVMFGQTIETVKESRANRSGGIMASLTNRVATSKNKAVNTVGRGLQAGSRNVTVQEKMQKKLSDAKELKDLRKKKKILEEDISDKREIRKLTPSKDLDDEIEGLRDELIEIEDKIERIKDGLKNKDDKKDSGGNSGDKK